MMSFTTRFEAIAICQAMGVTYGQALVKRVSVGFYQSQSLRHGEVGIHTPVGICLCASVGTWLWQAILVKDTRLTCKKIRDLEKDTRIFKFRMT